MGQSKLLRRVPFAVGMMSLCFAWSAAHAQSEVWRATWAASPSPWLLAEAPPAPAKLPTLTAGDLTIRNIVHISVGGERVRLRISNAFGNVPLVIHNVHAGLQASKFVIAAGTNHAATFNGEVSVSIPPGADVLSDPISLRAPPGANLAVSLTTNGSRPASTVHFYALQTSYSAPGDQSGDQALKDATEISSWPFLTEVQVAGEHAAAGTVVAVGDSITDGALSTAEMNRRWPNRLFERLQEKGVNLGVTDAGIVGNRLLHDAQGKYGTIYGVNALARFNRDVLDQAGVRFVIVLLGINDIGQPGSGGVPMDSAVSAKELELALSQLADHAHERGIRIMAGTLLPFGGAIAPGYYSPEKEQEREELNTWIRASRKFDGIAEFDKAVQDPTNPNQMHRAFDGGDHLHPNDAGDKALADSIPLSFFAPAAPLK